MHPMKWLIHECTTNRDWWGRLLEKCESDYLEDDVSVSSNFTFYTINTPLLYYLQNVFDEQHILVFIHMLLEKHRPDDKWMIVPQDFPTHLLLGADITGWRADSDLSPFPAWWHMDRVLISLCIPEVHWVTTGLDLRTWIVIIYDKQAL